MILRITCQLLRQFPACLEYIVTDWFTVPPIFFSLYSTRPTTADLVLDIEDGGKADSFPIDGTQSVRKPKG